MQSQLPVINQQPRKSPSKRKVGIVCGAILLVLFAVTAAAGSPHQNTTANLTAVNASNSETTQSTPAPTLTPSPPTTAPTVANPPQQSITPTPLPESTVQSSANTLPTCTNGTYINSAGNTVCSPEASITAPQGATAQCVDGAYSFSQHHGGTCSHHGGVAKWL